MRSIPKRYRDAFQIDHFDENGRRRSEKLEISDEAFLKKFSFPRRDPTFRNLEMFQYFIAYLPKKALKFFAGKPRKLLI